MHIRTSATPLSVLFLLSAAATAAVENEKWPTTTPVVTADARDQFKDNLSGLYYQPATTSNPAVLWAVQNSPSTLYKLRWNGQIYKPAHGGHWKPGKALHYPDGSGKPDAEGVTMSDDPSAVYVSTERDGDGDNRFSVLRFDTSQEGTSLTATHEWNLTSDLPAVSTPNLGLEAIAWVPDSYLTAGQFKDETTNETYEPARYPSHGAGLFFVGLEANGTIYAYALNHTNSSFTRIATLVSGHSTIMELVFDVQTGGTAGVLWAYCDNHCHNRAHLLAIDTASSSPTFGQFIVRRAFKRPKSMPDINNEGLAIAPLAECTNDLRAVVWADDSDTDGHALRRGTLPCAPL